MACSYNNQPAATARPQAPAYPFQCPNTRPGTLEQSPVAMAYVPWQQWQQTYSLEKGFERGTIFPDLDLTFNMGRCH
ncbi:MAG: spore coat associated protein CotJA [Hungatella sp.]|nr:spore coat associated protein CotJA [Hungatella sp.]MCI9503016.1 spore coat associated protein CotJA [Hungatella sp.]